MREKISSYIDNKKIEMIDFLKRLVSVDSSSHYKEGVDRLGKILSNRLRKLGYVIKVKENINFGDIVVARLKGRGKDKLLLLGHMDTVFERGEPAKRPFKIKNNLAYGPGVNDMKSGLVSLVYALESLHRIKFTPEKEIVCILTGDEEVGTPVSRSTIELEAKGSSYSLVLESARESGALVTSRKGTGMFLLKVMGRQAHAGVEPQKGINAIYELAHKIIELKNITDLKKGTTLSVGVISGGVRSNIVPDYAEAKIDLRVPNDTEAERVVKEVKRIVKRRYIKGVEVKLIGGLNRPPWTKTEESKELFKKAKKIGKELGIEIKEESTGGGSDGNFIAALGIPTLDGLGPVGGGSHSKEEWVELKSIPERTKLLALLITELTSMK